MYNEIWKDARYKKTNKETINDKKLKKNKNKKKIGVQMFPWGT